MGAKECDLETVFVLLKFKEYVFKPPFGGLGVKIKQILIKEKQEKFQL